MLSCLLAKAQEPIIYSFEQPVTDSLLKGITQFEKSYNKDFRHLKLLALIVEDPTSTQILIVEYSPIKLNGFQQLVNSTNRKLRVRDTIFLPILFPSDEHTLQFMSDNVEGLPHGGFSVLVQYYRHKIKSIHTSEQF